MEGNEKVYAQLLSLLAETLRVSDELLCFTRLKYDLLSGEDENELIGTLKTREKFISALINLENRIDLILDESALDRNDLPWEAAKLAPVSSLRSRLRK